MSDDEQYPIYAGVIAGMLLLFAFILGSRIKESNIKENAIRAGVAYYTNDASGTVQFKWKEAKP